MSTVSVELNIEEFINVARLTQQSLGKTMRGNFGLSSKAITAIHQASLEVAFPTRPDSLTAQHIEELGLKFEEMCRRQKRTIDDHLRPRILTHLAAELAININALNLSAEKLIYLTIYHGGIGPSLLRDFKVFADKPGIFRHAAVHNVRDPRAFLSRVQAEIGALAAEEEFKDFADSPGIFKIAAIGYSSDPRAFLRRVQAEIGALAAEEEFKDFTDTPGIFKYAATHNARDPRAFLRRVQAEIVALAAEEEFKDLADAPGIFKMGLE